jgi:hypothetical protein
LVVEVINGRDKVVEELMGDKAVGEMEGGSGIRGRRIRERGELGEGDLWFLGGKKIWGKKEEEERMKEGVLVNSLA